MSTASAPVIAKGISADKPSSAEERADQVTEHTMRDYYAAQPKVSIKTREDEWVQVNGYTFIIKAGERVEVPKDIAAILEESGRI
jgi:deoxycytidine triphosphate deaminase